MGTFENKVDRKGRVSVPAPFRQSLATSSYPGIVVFRSHRSDAVESCDIEFMNQLNGRVDAYDLFSDEHDDLVFTLFADAFQLPFDGEGRIILPPALAEHASITDRAAFVGRGTRFQIWAPEAFEKHQASAIEALRSRLRTNGGGR